MRRFLGLAAAGVLAMPVGAAAAQSGVQFDGSAGTKAPPGRLHGLRMLKFGHDPQPQNAVRSVTGPTGQLSFSRKVVHTRIGPRTWKTWSNHYRGDVYYTGARTLTLTPPHHTAAFYLYVEPNNARKLIRFTLSSGAASSGPVKVDGNRGARFFAFYATGQGASLSSITITCASRSGFAIGEFGIHRG